MAKIFSDYVRKSLSFLGGTVELDVRCLDRSEAPAFATEARRIQTLWFTESPQKEGEDEESYRVRLQALMDTMDVFLKDMFTRTKQTKAGEKGYFIRLVEPMENEDDDERSIKDCAALYERASITFRFTVAGHVLSQAELDPFLGNSFGSPSTSTVGAGLNTTASPVTTTADTVSQAPSTATAVMGPELSSPAV